MKQRSNLSLFLEKRFLEMRARSIAICEHLENEDFVVQPISDISPPKWHLAHTTWLLEEVILNKLQNYYQFFNQDYRLLFNSYYKTLGEHWIQENRGKLSRPTVREVLEYRQYVDKLILKLFKRDDMFSEFDPLIELAINHEEQHQELLLMDIKYILGCNPSSPVYSKKDFEKDEPKPIEWNYFTEGIYEIGENVNQEFTFDNERPCHKVYIYPFGLSNRLVTNGEFLNFINDGGYEKSILWLSKGYDWVRKNTIRSPLYWKLDKNMEWNEFTLYGQTKLDLNLPVSHISYFEAQAFANWMGMRLPTEQEFEISQERCDSPDHFHRYHPKNLGVYNSQLWCWTQSHYSPYPGFKPFLGDAYEYNGKFMCNQFVLKGGCVVTPHGHYRKTYRNFYEPHQRWMFSGICLAKDYL